jgi:hypothetical protein
MAQLKNRGLVISFFPHTTCKLQGISKSFMGPMQMYCSYDINQYSVQNNHAVRPHNITELGKETWETAQNGFIKWNITPFTETKIYIEAQLRTENSFHMVTSGFI